MHVLQVGAQNQNAAGVPASEAPSNVPPPTSGLLNCSAAGTSAGARVSVDDSTGAALSSPPAEASASLVPVESAPLAAGDVVSAVVDASGPHAATSSALAASTPTRVRRIRRPVSIRAVGDAAPGTSCRAPVTFGRLAGVGPASPIGSGHMRTRTLLLLAIACGLAVLVAGLFALMRIDRQESSTQRVVIGEVGRAGDLEVIVSAAIETDGLMRVTVVLGGVDDPAVLDNVRLVVPGQLLAPLDPAQAGDGACAGVTVPPRSCELVFGVATVEGSARSLLVRRGEDQLRWDLAVG